MPNRKDADVVGRWRGQDDFRDQVRFQESSPEENHCCRDDEPRCCDPLHRVNHLVIERKVIDEENGNSRARIKDKWRPARPAVDSDLVDAEGEKIRAKYTFSLEFGFAFAVFWRHAGNYCAPPPLCPRLDSCGRSGHTFHRADCDKLLIQRKAMERQFTAIIEKRGKWYVATVEEIPGVNTQGRTLAEARRNLKEALQLVLDANRELAARDRSRDAKRELISIQI